MTLQVARDGLAFAEEFCRLRDFDKGGFVVCVPPTRWPTKSYPARHWRKVISAVGGEMPVVVLGGPGDRQFCRAVARDLEPAPIDLGGKTTVAEMVGLIAASGGVVCSDSAAKFIGAAVGVEVIVLVGPTRIERTGPYLRGRALVAEVNCQGCLKKRCGHVTCMQLIDPSRVVRAVTDSLVKGVG